MTTSLLPEPATPAGPPVESDDTGPRDRWVLHRAGVLNVWQYDRVELRFGGGRLLLRGKNGAGKSKALEVMLPFLLDGDTRRLDATGRDRTTVTWLMTDGRGPGNHVGYVWLELRCADSDTGTERFLTLGAGLKASTATRRHDAWFFITDRRVGVDLELDRSGECLSVDRLKEAIGEEAVTASGAEHRRRVGRHVFGLFDEARFANLLHLLHRLRDPNIGNRVEAGELANVLSEALPPIDETIVADAAGRFDDLDTIREQVERAQRTADALGRFLGTYRGYARTVLRRRANAVAAGEADRARAARAVRQAERSHTDAEEAVTAATEQVGLHEADRAAADDERRALERSDAYRAHQDLVDRQERVEALAVAATTAESSAARAVEAVRRTEAETSDAERLTRAALAGTASAARNVADLAVAVGLERTLLGAAVATDPDGSPADGAVAAADDAARRANLLVDTRSRRATEVRKLAVQVERTMADADAADARAADSEAQVDDERVAASATRAARDAAEQAWADAVVAWSDAGLTGTCGATWTAVHAAVRDRRGEVGWPDAVRRAVVEAIDPPLRRARLDTAAADARVATSERAVDDAEVDVADLEAQSEAQPERGHYHDAPRDLAAGAPFYELVDLAPGVAAAAAAGIEAALESAGLLDAWVAADGLVVHPRTHDTILRAGDGVGRAPGRSIAGALVPAVADGAPVSAATVERVLAAIGLGEHGDDVTAWVTDDGRWSLGAVHGAWSKATVEFLGAGAREATRQRRLAELRDARDAARAERDAARDAATAAAERRDALDALAATLPPADAVVTAHQDVNAAERSLAAARARHAEDQRQAETRRAAANRLAAELHHQAGGDGLATTVDALDELRDAIGQLRQGLGEHRRSLQALADHAERWAARRVELGARQAEAAEARAGADERRAAHRSAAHELDTLRAAVGASVDAVLAALEGLTTRIDELQHRLLPAARQRRDHAVGARSDARSAVDSARDAEGATVAGLAAAATALAGAVALPGVVLAATDADQIEGFESLEPPDFAGRVLALVDGDDDVADSTVLARYDRLSQDLAGGYDTAIDEVDGVKVVHVDDDNGRQPLAAVARRLADEAAAARSRLAAREREVLERFLLRELADEVRAKLLDAHDLVRGTNATLAGVHTSHGKGAHLDWTVREDAAAPAGVAAELLVDELRGDDGDARLRDALLALIEAERASDPTASYEQHLRAALDYRRWHRFVVRVTDTAAAGSARVLSNRLGLSQGEQRVLSYLALFAAASAQFDAIAKATPTAPRLLLLDDAFAKVDEPTHGRLLGLLVDLRLDFVVTSERLWGCFPTVPSLDIYEAIRDPAQAGVALVHFRWDGRHRALVGV